MVSEEILHFIWRCSLFPGQKLKTTCGTELEIIRPGEQNLHAGPDFFAATIKTGNLIWAGNVEMHVLASGWNKHGHQLDPAYDNVILHVVSVFDTDVYNSKERRIPTLVLYDPETLTSRYISLKENKSWLPCDPYIRKIDSAEIKSWLHIISARRLARKTGHLVKIVTQYRQNREQALLQVLAYGFGLPVNTLPFEWLIAGVPYDLLYNIRDNQALLESLFFGHSGLLPLQGTYGYYAASLTEGYELLKRELQGRPLPPHIWKFLRIRPASFPTLRLSQFAAMLHTYLPLTGSILSVKSVTELEQIFRIKARDYWDTHYLFGKSSPFQPKYPGQQFIHTLIINAIIPFLRLLEENNRPPLSGLHSAEILGSLSAESNHIIRKWQKFGIKPDNALESQALIELHHVYCKQKRCLDCQIGIKIVHAFCHEEQ